MLSVDQHWLLRPKTWQELAGRAVPTAQNAYTMPPFRDRLKRQVLRSSKGARAGQWSARKAQLLDATYKRAGGGYRQAKTAMQRSLIKWAAEK